MRCLLVVILVLAVAVPALAGHPFGVPFDLGVGQSRVLGDDEVTVGFDGVASDSRCPTGVWCFWEGDAAVDLWLQVPGDPRVDFQLHTYYQFDQMIEVGPYTVVLVEVAPYPDINIPIDPADYTVNLIVLHGVVDVEAKPWGTLKALYR
jgi:hypothetical protein